MKTKKLNNIFAMFLFVMVLVLSGCSKYDGPDTPTPPTPDPEVTLEKVEKVSCTTISSAWDGENVTLKTRSAYDAMYRDGAFWAVSKVDYAAKLTYSDGKVVNQTKGFDVTNNANAFWGKKTGYIKDINYLKNTAPSTEVRPIEEGTLNFISWAGIWDVAIVVKNTKSVESLDFAGKTVNDLCAPEMTITYKNVVITDLHRDSLNFHLYEVALVLDAEINEGTDKHREVTLGSKKFWQPTDGGDIPGTDPEIVLYQLRKAGFEYKTKSTSRSYATLVAIYTDGEEKEVKTIETTVNNYSKISDKQEYVVPNFNYIESEPRLSKMVKDGSERVSTENTDIFLTGYLTNYITGTNYFSCTSEGHFEIPVYTDPLGKKHTMLYKEYEMRDMGIVRGNIKNEGNFQILPLTVNVDATFNERLYNLSAEVDLKNPNGAIEEKLTGLNVINVRVIDEYIHYDLIRYFPSQNTTTAMKVLHGAKQSAEERKNTKDRNYDFSSAVTDTLSKTAFTDGKHSGRLVKFTKTYHYSDFDNIITNEVRDNIIYSEEGFSALIFAGAISCDKVGSVLGTEDFGDTTQHIYDDEINYQLNIGSVKAAGCTQIVRYTEDIPETEITLKGISIINIRVINEYINYDLVRTFSDASSTTTAMKVLHMASQTAEARKETKERNYVPRATRVDTLSRTTFSDGKHSGRFVRFSKTYSYNDFDNIITNEVRTDIVYTESGFSAPIYAGSTLCDRANVVLGTTDLGDSKKHIYDDEINYQLNIGSVKAAGCTQIVRYTEDIETKKKLISVEEEKVEGNNHHIIIRFDDNSTEKDIVNINKPVTLTGGKIADLNRDDLNFGQGSVNHNQSPSAGSSNTNGRVTATSYTHIYPVSYNNHNHNVTGTYNKYVYSYTYEDITKSCNLTSPILQVENTSVDLGTSKKDTVDLKIYETTPVTFAYSGTYGTQTAPATVKTNNVNYIGDVVVKTSFVFAGMARILSPTENSFYNGVILKVSGEKNGYRVIIPQITYDKFYDATTITNSGKIEAAVWNGIDYLPCEVLVDNNQQVFAYDAKNTAGNKKLPMTFAEALIAGIKNYSGNINVTVTPIIAGATAVKSNGKTIVSLGGAVVLVIDDEIENSSRSSRR